MNSDGRARIRMARALFVPYLINPELKMTRRNSTLLIALSCCLAVAACNGRDEVSPSYTPGLGEIMTFTQMRHTKLWLAGEAENWDLDAFGSPAGDWQARQANCRGGVRFPTMKFGFNVVQRPTADAFPNQNFSPPAAVPQ